MWQVEARGTAEPELRAWCAARVEALRADNEQLGVSDEAVEPVGDGDAAHPSRAELHRMLHGHLNEVLRPRRSARAAAFWLAAACERATGALLPTELAATTVELRVMQRV